MKSLKKLVYFIFLLAIHLAVAQSADAQLIFQKTYSLSTRTTPISQPDGEGGIVTGGTYQEDPLTSPAKVSLTRFDRTGKVIWSKNYTWSGGSLNLVSFILAENGDYMLAGYLLPKDNSSPYKIFLLRINKNGEILWARNFNKEYSSVFYSLCRTNDNGFFLYANHNDAPSGLPYNIVLKVDKDGKLKWARRYFDTYKWGIATATKDGGLVISNIGTVYKINTEGKIVWAKEYDGLHSHDIRTITELSDGGILLIAQHTNGKDGFLLKLDKNGNILWTKEGGKFYNYNCVPLPEPAGNFLVASTFARSTGNYNSCIWHVSAVGKILRVVYPKTGINIHQLTLVRGNIFINGTYFNKDFLKFYQVTGKINNLEPGKCMDTLTFSSNTPPVISYSNVNVITQQDINFQQEHLQLDASDFEVQEDTLCYECIKPALNLGNDTTLCYGKTLNLKTEIPAISYEWSTGEKESNIEINKAGKYWLKINYDCGTVTDTIIVDYNKTPEFRMKVGPMVAKPWDQIYFSDSSSGIKNWYWDFGDGSFSNASKAEHTYGKNGDFTVNLQLEDSFGCKYSFSENVKVHFESLYLPNAFSPDGNGLNDTFGCIGYGIDYYKLKIYNRWGELIFDKENQAWDGKNNGTYCPTGIYLYMLEARFDKKTVNRYGYVYLEK